MLICCMRLAFAVAGLGVRKLLSSINSFRIQTLSICFAAHGIP